jgi:hypothetical protein
MESYAVVSYDNRRDDDNEIEIILVCDNFDYANKLAFHYAKQQLPKKEMYSRSEYRIIKNNDEYNSIYLHGVVVDYRIAEVIYDDECEEYEKYDIDVVWNIVWAVVKIKNDISEIELEEIDEKLLYE